MKKQAEILKNRWNMLNREIETQLYATARSLQRDSTKQVLIYDVADYGIRVGTFESLINGYPLLESIQIWNEGIFLKLELLQDYEPLSGISTFSTVDKIEILKLLEKEITH